MIVFSLLIELSASAWLSDSDIDLFPINEHGLIVLTDDTYREALRLYDTIFLAFEAHWCGMCSRMIPKWAQAITEVASKEYPLVVYAVTNGSINRAVLNYFDVSSYPTFLLIHKNKKLGEYYSHSDSEKLLHFMKQHLTPLGEEIVSVAHLQETIDDNDVVIGYFGNSTADMDAISNVLSNGYSHIPFLYLNNYGIHEKIAKLPIKVDTPKKLVLYKKYDEKQHEMPIKEGLTKEKVEEFLKMYSMPLVMKYNQNTSDYVFKKHNPAVFFIQSEKNTTSSFNQSDIEEIAKEFRGSIQFVLIESLVSDVNSNFAKMNNISIDDLPIVRYYDTKNQLNQFDIAKPYDVEALKNSIKKTINESENIKSQPIPLEMRGSVFVLDDKSFNREVIDNDYDVLVKFYAPWCGHCKELAPIYEQLAKRFASNAMIRIAEIDASLYNIESISLKGYPTLVYFPKGKKTKPIFYKGERTFIALERFVNSNSVNKLKDPIKSDL